MQSIALLSYQDYFVINRVAHSVLTTRFRVTKRRLSPLVVQDVFSFFFFFFTENTDAVVEYVPRTRGVYAHDSYVTNIDIRYTGTRLHAWRLAIVARPGNWNFR